METMNKVSAGPARLHRKPTPVAHWQEWISESAAQRRLETRLVPAPSHQQIAERAYGYWLARGCPIGSPEADWFRAERELRNSL
jgi:DUF2934 family protein